MRQPTESWNEFDWEQALRENDQFAAQYFGLLRRFSDLPGADELIAKRMGPEFDIALADADLEMDPGAGHDDEFGAAVNWAPEQESDSGADFPVDEDEDDPPLDFGDSGCFEADPTFITLRQAAIGWCNIYAAVLPQDARAAGLIILFHIGRALANLAYSIDESAADEPAPSIAFAKRARDQLNLAIGHLNDMATERPSLRRILTTIRNHLLRANDALLDHLERRRRASKPDTGHG